MEWSSVLHGLLFFLPAYVANMSPVLAAKLVPRLNAPIDGGRLAKDGKRLLGAGKTWRGLVAGAVAGAVTATVIALVVPPYDASGVFHGWDYGHKGFTGPDVGSNGCTHNGGAGGVTDGQCSNPVVRAALWRVALFGAILGFAALLGDSVKSYFKRRRGKEGGAPWFPFDQLDFVVFGVAAAFLATPLLPMNYAYAWVLSALTRDWLVLATIVILTPLLHFLVNVIGYWMKLKDVPW